MNENPYAPPGAVVADPEHPVSLDRPRSVVLAVRLLWTGFAISLMASVYGLFTLPAGARVAYILMIRIIAVGVALAVTWAAFTALWRGRGWVRWVIVVLIVLGLVTMTLWAVLPLGTRVTWQTAAPMCVRIALYSLATVMLFSPTANAWYREKKRWR